MTPEGEIEVQTFSEMQVLNDSIKDFLKEFETSYTQIYQNFKELAADFDNLCHTLTRIHSSFESLSQLHKHD